MQQTNFTATAATQNPQTAAAGVVNLTGNLITDTLGLANGDIVLVQAGIRLRNTNGGEALAFNPTINSDAGALEDFGMGLTLTTDTDYFFEAELWLQILGGKFKAVWPRATLWQDTNTVEAETGKYIENINAAYNRNLSIQNEFDYDVTWTLFYAILTRIRSGL